MRKNKTAAIVLAGLLGISTIAGTFMTVAAQTAGVSIQKVPEDAAQVVQAVADKENPENAVSSDPVGDEQDAQAIQGDNAQDSQAIQAGTAQDTPTIQAGTAQDVPASQEGADQASLADADKEVQENSTHTDQAEISLEDQIDAEQASQKDGDQAEAGQNGTIQDGTGQAEEVSLRRLKTPKRPCRREITKLPEIRIPDFPIF